MNPKIDELTYEYPTDRFPVVVGEWDGVNPNNRCGCEGSCPSCILGEVEDHECNRCKRIFCPHCHGIKMGAPSKKVKYCSCPIPTK
ncbi:MAG: hypothetical protein UX71_C0005G0079 [Parcubacteria group bacterium GW2011_GWA1_47_10]|nr:MAG: hypothetical protein UX71_C0005G0079 [Parcubacteria group bacterium GW2011_GWA1_47_10]